MPDPLIDSAVLLGICDRLGVQKSGIGVAVAAAAAVGTGLHYTRVSGTQVYEVERDLITPANNLDEALTAQDVITEIPEFSGLVTGLAIHVGNAGYATFGAMLTAEELRVSHNFAELWYWLRSEALPALQVFYETAVDMGSFDKSSGAWAFTDGSALGTGSGSYSSVNHAPQAVRLRVDTFGGVQANLTVTLRDPDGTTTFQKTVTVLASANPGDYVAVTTGAEEALDVISVIATGGSDGDSFTFLSIPERVPAL